MPPDGDSMRSLQVAGEAMAKHVGDARGKAEPKMRCNIKRSRQRAAAPGISSASALRWPYQWFRDTRPPHPCQMERRKRYPPSPGYYGAVDDMMKLTASVISGYDNQAAFDNAIKCFHGYALPIFHWARENCNQNIHLFTQLVNDAFVNLTVGKNREEPQMYYDCGDMFVTVMNAHAYHIGGDRENNARFNCVSATHFALLGHLYWREQRWEPTNADVVAVYYQLHITIRHLSSKRANPLEFYENTMGVHFDKTAYQNNIDATMTNEGATLKISDFTDLVCSHRINALELCRDTLIRGCDDWGEAKAWSVCSAQKVPVPSNKCGSVKGKALHFMCAYESMFTELPALKSMLATIHANVHLQIGFPVVFRRLAIWLAIHQGIVNGTVQCKDIRSVILNLFQTFDSSRAVTVCEDTILANITKAGATRPALQKEIMSEMTFVYMMVTTTRST